MNIFYWLHSFSPQPIAFSLGQFNFYWYGIILATAIIVGLLLTINLARYKKIDFDLIFDLATWLVISGLVGARLYDVLLEYKFYLNQPLDIIKIWQGGLAIHGALLGGTIVLIIFSRVKRLNLLTLVSIILPGVALGQSIGRFGNWFNQELFGLPTTLPWGIPVALFNRPLGYENYLYFHPTFLYEALGMLLVAIVLYVLVKNNKLKAWSVLGSYLLAYGLIRFSLEFIKIDNTLMVFGWRWPQIVSLLMILGGVILMGIKKDET